jgi:hypothetical protein
MYHYGNKVESKKIRLNLHGKSRDQSKAFKKGVELIKVSPAYTSMLGSIKYKNLMVYISSKKLKKIFPLQL